MTLSFNDPCEHVWILEDLSARSAEVDTLRETSLQRGRSFHEYRGGQQGVDGDAPAHHTESAPNLILPVQRKLANLADVPSALSLLSEEQCSKCTYPLCFDFSQRPLTQPFHVLVYNHHFRDVFNLKYPGLWTVLWPSLHFWSSDMYSLTLTSTHIYIYTHLLLNNMWNGVSAFLKFLPSWVEIPGPLPQRKTRQRPGNIAVLGIHIPEYYEVVHWLVSQLFPWY